MKLLVILAAGEGTRLRPLTNEVPKCMVKVDNTPMVDKLLAHFEKWADRIIVVTGYKSEVLEAHLKSLEDQRISTIFNSTYNSTNSMYSASLTDHLWSEFDEIIFTNSDVVFSQNVLSKLLDNPISDGITLAVDVKKCDMEDMRVRIDPDTDRVIEISKKIPLADSNGEFTGVAKVKGDGIAQFSTVIRSLLKEDEMKRKGWYDLVFDHIAQNIEPISYVTIATGKYYEIDTLEDLEELKEAHI